MFSSNVYILQMLPMLKMLPAEVKKEWIQWVDQVPVIGFNSGKYDINMLKKYFVNKIGYDRMIAVKMFVCCKEGNYVYDHL